MILGYCMACHAEMEIQDPHFEYLETNGRRVPRTIGTCPRCGNRIARFGQTNAQRGEQAMPDKPERNRADEWERGSAIGPSLCGKCGLTNVVENRCVSCGWEQQRPTMKQMLRRAG